MVSKMILIYSSLKVSEEISVMSVPWAMSRTSPSLLTTLSRPDTFQPTPGLTVSHVESALTTGREFLKVGYIILFGVQTFKLYVNRPEGQHHHEGGGG